MLKLAAGSLAAGWVLLVLIGLGGHLRWDNPLLWGPLVLFGASAFLGFGGWNHERHRGPLLLTGALAFCCMLGYAVFYVFLFGLVGH